MYLPIQSKNIFFASSSGNFFLAVCLEFADAIFVFILNKQVIKNNQEILLDLTDFAVQEQPADNLMVAISRPWYK